MLTILEMVSSQPVRLWRIEAACSGEWHLPQTLTVSSCPGPGGRSAFAAEARKRKEAQRAKRERVRIVVFSIYSILEGTGEAGAKSSAGRPSMPTIAPGLA